MSIFETIQGKLIEARKSKDSAGISFWGTVLARVKIIEKGPQKLEFTDKNVLPILRKILKETKETLEMASGGNRQEAAEKAKVEIDLLSAIIPADQQEVSEEDIRTEIAAIISGIPEDQKKKAMGAIMKGLKAKFGDRVDGKTASAIAKTMIS